MARSMKHYPAFLAFHRDGPHVAKALEAYIADQLAKGRQRIGMKEAFEALRWDPRFRTNGEPYKLNNNFTSFYADLIVRRNPQWDRHIERRNR